MIRPLLSGKRTALAAALFCCLLWGSAFPAVKAGLAYFPPTFFAGARFAVAGAAVLLLSAPRKGPLFPPGSIAPVLAIGLFQTVIGYWLFFQGMDRSSAVTGAVINSSGPLVVWLLAFLVLGEGGWSALRLAGIAAGFAGVVIALLQPGWRPGFTPGGEGLLLLSTVSLSWASILAKKIAGNVDAGLIAGGSMLSGGLVLLGGALLAGEAAGAVFNPASLAILLYTAFISAAAFTLWYALLRHHPVAMISTVKFAIPIFGALLSAIFLGERVSVFKGAGGILVGLGVSLIFLQRDKGEEPGIAGGP